MAEPIRVLQSMSESCWAACMQCWTKEAYYYTPRLERDLVNSYSGKEDTGGLDTNSVRFRTFLDQFWLSQLVFLPGMLTESKVKIWLLSGLFFIVIVKTSDNTSHARLAYDYDEASGILSMMEPDASSYSPFRGNLAAMPRALVLFLDPKKIPGN